MSIDWHRLRTWQGSQANAFEELCCQLASHEPVPPGGRFWRVAAPDGGVECYWALASGEEWGWQAKFFQDKLGASQWAQLKESFTQALETHPKLKRYTVCLPRNPSDPREGSKPTRKAKGPASPKTTERAEWDRHQMELEQLALGKGREVQVEYWDETRIVARLSTDIHRGRRTYWFNTTEFHDAWFRDQIELSIKNAGERYHPELNVPLHLEVRFDTLGRATALRERVFKAWGRARRLWRDLHLRAAESELPDSLAILSTACESLFCEMSADWIKRLDTVDDLSDLDFEARVREARELADALRGELWRLERPKRVAAPGTEQSPNREPDPDHEARKVGELYVALRTLMEEFDGDDHRLLRRPVLVLTGEAGTGKTHLLCDLAERRVREGLPTMLLLGEAIRPGHLHEQIPAACALKGVDLEELIGALQAAAEARGRRALLMVDAINESDANTWKAGLHRLLLFVDRNPAVGLVLSVRTGYERACLPAGLMEEVVRVEHQGFAQEVDQALARYFAHYQIDLPKTPILIPEFRNPLFLFLLCRSLQQKGMRCLPPGFRGANQIFEFFLDHVDDRLSERERCDLPPGEHIVRRALAKLAERMVELKTEWIPKKTAREALDLEHHASTYSASLLPNLLREGILQEVPDYWSGDDDADPRVRFSFQRLADLMQARVLLSRARQSGIPPERWLRDDGPCQMLVSADRWRWTGVLEAMSIDLSEKEGRELVDLMDPSDTGVLAATVRGLAWRRDDAFTPRTAELVLEALNCDSTELRDHAFEVLLQLATRPEHPLNTDWLHNRLAPLSMPDRDLIWSTMIFERYEDEDSLLRRLVDWAWREETQQHVDDESARLWATLLVWCLSTSHRFLRDCATKALVSLLTRRPSVLRQVYAKFNGLDEPYIQERLHAVVYGCITRCEDSDAVRELSSEVYETIFAGGSPPAHVLLRDYARATMEFACARGLLAPGVEPAYFRPPFSSVWDEDIPSIEELEGCLNASDADGQRRYSALLGSMSVHGDFCRYELGTNHWSFPWRHIRIGAPTPETRRAQVEKWAKGLSPSQRKRWKAYERMHTFAGQVPFLSLMAWGNAGDRSAEGADMARHLEVLRKHYPNSEALQQDTRKYLDESKAVLHDALGEADLAIFDDLVEPYLRAPLSANDYMFPIDLARRWILQRILELGWNEEQMGWFDRHHGRDGYRSANKPERLGKKYQWIALHQFFATVEDNFERHPPRRGETRKGLSEWNSPHRDVDPTCILRTTYGQNGHHDDVPRTWWSPIQYDCEATKISDHEWIECGQGLPDPTQLFTSVRPSDGSRWLTLDHYRRWEEPLLPGDEHLGRTQRDLSFGVHAYIVRRRDLRQILDWATRRQRTWDDLPRDSGSTTRSVMLRDRWWAPYTQEYSPLGQRAWERERRYTQREGTEDNAPTTVALPVNTYLAEGSTHDCSVGDGYGFRIPSAWIMDALSLRPAREDGLYLDDKGQIAMFDPTLAEPGPSALLLREDLLQKLRDCGYDILWTVLGEQRILVQGGPHAHEFRENESWYNIWGAWRLSAGTFHGRLMRRKLREEDQD